MTNPLPPFKINKASLLQHVSRTRYRAQALHYGTAATNRYDDPQQRYGVLYLGPDLATALMNPYFTSIGGRSALNGRSP